MDLMLKTSPLGPYLGFGPRQLLQPDLVPPPRDCDLYQ